MLSKAHGLWWCLAAAVAAVRTKAFVAPRGTLRAPPSTRATLLKSNTPLGERSKKRVIDAVEELGGRVTAADVAGAGAAELMSAERELLALASRFGGKATLEATESGDVVFDFGRTPSKTLASVDRKERWLRRWQAIKPKALQAGRVTFGLCLFASLAVVAALLTVAATSDRESNNNSHRDTTVFLPRPTLLWDMMYYQPYYETRAKDEMNFLEAIFSYVFGEGDPNYEKRTRELESAAAIIRANDGVVVAEQLAPVVADAPPTLQESGVVVDETWVLPIASALGGRPEVVGDSIVYVFDDLVDGSLYSSQNQKGAPAVLKEKELTFSAAGKGQRVFAGALGAANAFIVALLGAEVVADPLLLKAIPALKYLLLPLTLYAVTYNVVPIVRALRLGRANQDIRQRNANRLSAAKRLLNPSNGLRSKLRAARTAAADVVLRRRRKRPLSSSDDVAYSTTDQAARKNLQAKTDTDFADFDAKLRRSSSPPDKQQADIFDFADIDAKLRRSSSLPDKEEASTSSSS